MAEFKEMGYYTLEDGTKSTDIQNASKRKSSKRDSKASRGSKRQSKMNKASKEKSASKRSASKKKEEPIA